MADYSYNAKYTVDAKYGIFSMTITANGSFSPNGLSAGSPLVLNTNDRIFINVDATSDPFNYQGGPANIWHGGIGWTFTSGTLDAYGQMTAGNTYVFTHSVNIGTNNTDVATFGLAGFYAGPTFIYWKQNLDSIPTIPDLSTAQSNLGYTVDKTFTVSGLATNAYAYFYISKEGSVKVNSGSFVREAYAKNGDTVTFRGVAPTFYDGSRNYYVVVGNAAKVGYAGPFAVKTISNPIIFQGFECYNSAGALLCSVSSRTGRIAAVGSFTVNVAASTTHVQTVYVAGVANTEDWIVVSRASSSGSFTTDNVTKNSGSFDVTVKNNSSSSAYDVTVYWQVIYSG